jgi:lysyl-tRNA synthetase class 2
MWQPTLTWQDAKNRADVLRKIRDFFQLRSIYEVETPALCSNTVTDVFLEGFSTKYNYSSVSNIEEYTDFYLQTSPEFSMKRLLASGYGSIFQICKAFRHEDAGKFHNPEFTMLEWYRLGFSQTELIDEVEALLVSILSCKPADKVTYQEIFLLHTMLDPLNASFDELYDYIASVEKESDWLKESKDSDVLLQFIFSECIENKIGNDAPCFVYNFPANQASLAVICQQDPRVAKRFECYYKGIELVNGFEELTDPKIQLERFHRDNIKRLALGLNEITIDRKLIEALDFGLPDCSGVALGIDRLVMLALENKTIAEVITFPIDRA